MEKALYISNLQRAAIEGLCRVGQPAQFVVDRGTGRWTCIESLSPTPFIFLLGIKYFIDRLALFAARSSDCSGRFALTPCGVVFGDELRPVLRFIVASSLDGAEGDAADTRRELVDELVA
jgi:hypothetical protein